MTHVTTYRYSEPVAVSHNVLHLAPLSTARQRVREYHLTVTPPPAVAHVRQDYFHNHIDDITVQDKHTELCVRAESVVEVDAIWSIDPQATPAWEAVRAALNRPVDSETIAAAEFRYESPLVPIGAEFAAFAFPSFTPARPLLAAAIDLIHRIFTGFTYDGKATGIDTPVSQVLNERRGVCQDFAQVALAAIRSLGLAARYVSGYLETQSLPGEIKLQGADASHAWISVFVPGSGWVDLDPTNDCIVGERHITVAIGRDFTDVSPIKGVILGGGHHQVCVGVDVVRL